MTVRDLLRAAAENLDGDVQADAQAMLEQSDVLVTMGETDAFLTFMLHPAAFEPPSEKTNG